MIPGTCNRPWHRSTAAPQTAYEIVVGWLGKLASTRLEAMLVEYRDDMHRRKPD